LLLVFEPNRQRALSRIKYHLLVR